MSSFILADSSSVFWSVSVDDTGALTKAVVPNGPPLLLVLACLSNGQNFKIVVSTGGVVSGTPLNTLGVSGATHAVLISPGNIPYDLFVAIDGSMFTERDPSWSPGFEVGELYPTEYYPKFQQPGGIGTPTFPEQQIGEKLGQFSAGCGHFFQNWYVPSSAYLGIPSCYICCPICGWIQQILTPQSLLYTDAYFIVIG